MQTFITREKLNKIFEEHKHWINEDCKNWEEIRANLRNADLSYTNLHNADLSNADFNAVNLYNADLRGAKNVPYIPMVCPEEGSFIGWKKPKLQEDVR